MLHFPLESWLTVQAAVEFRKDKEVAFFGRAILDREAGRIVVDNILIPPQEIGSVSADVDVKAGDMDWLVDQIIKRGLNPADYRFWGHSHAGMGTSPSGTDHSTLKELAEMFGGWAVGAVFNNKMECHGWLAFKLENPVFGTSKLEELVLPVTYDSYRDDRIILQVNEWMKHVIIPQPKVLQAAAGYTPGAGFSHIGGNTGHAPFLQSELTGQAPSTYDGQTKASKRGSGRGGNASTEETQEKDAAFRSIHALTQEEYERLALGEAGYWSDK